MFTFEISDDGIDDFEALNTQLQIEIVNESKTCRMRHKIFIEIKRRRTKKKKSYGKVFLCNYYGLWCECRTEHDKWNEM